MSRTWMAGTASRLTSRPAGPWLLLGIIALMVGCSTGSRDIETPEGARGGDQTGPFIVLGVLSRGTSTLHQSNAHNAFSETIKVNVPVGTALIVPAVRGWTMGYGSTTPEDLSGTPGPVTWHREDHNLGASYFNVFVQDIDAPDPATNTQTATIVVEMLLSDDNSDDDWFGYVNYTLLCLGRHP